MQIQTEREQKGFEISKMSNTIRRINVTHYKVKSQTSHHSYDVQRDGLREGKENAKRIPAIMVSDSHQSYRKAVKKEIYQKTSPQPQHLRVSPIKKGWRICQ